MSAADSHLRPTPARPRTHPSADPVDPTVGSRRTGRDADGAAVPDGPEATPGPIRLDGRPPRSPAPHLTVAAAGGVLALLAAGVIAWRAGDDDDPAAGRPARPPPPPPPR